MRKLFTVLFAMGIMMSGLMTAAAQDVPSAVATGFDTPATWIDERGNEVATVEVTGIESDWDGYSEYSRPERGYMYVAVSYSVTNISGASMIVEPYDFSLLDVYGRNNGSAYVSLADDATDEIFEDDRALAADEVAELTQIFQIPADVAPAALMWQPDSGMLVMVDISEGSIENSALANGLNAPATWTDDRGNPVATFEVTGITSDWQDYDEFYEPERGMVYVALDIKVTNVSDSSLIVEPYDFSLMDVTGMNNGRSWAQAAQGVDPLFTDDVPLAAGESYEGTVVFELLADTQPAVFSWQPDSGLLHIVNLSEGSAPTEATPTDGTPVATPAS